MRLPLAFLLGVLGLMAFAEDAVPLRELPPLVRERLAKAHPSARLLSATRDERNDYVHFRVKLVVDGRAHLVEVLENGTIVSDSSAK